MTNNKGAKPVFISRPVPTEREVKNFEKAILEEVREEEIEDNLSEIYRDKSGAITNVSEIHQIKEPLFISIIKKIFVIAVLASLAYGFYSYFFRQAANIVSVDLKITAPDNIKSGESFTYLISYKNNSKFALNSLKLELKYPDNFILDKVSGENLDITPDSSAQNYFSLPPLPVNEEATIVVFGKIIAKEKSVNLFAANLSYEPGNFSSEFKKEAVASVAVNALSFALNFDYANAALVGEDNKINLVFSDLKDDFLNDFEISFVFPENINLQNLAASSTASTSVTINRVSNLIWQVNGLASSTKTYELPLSYQITKKISDNQELIIRLSKKMPNGKSYVFVEKNIELNVVNSSLDLGLTLNDLKNDNTANFDDSLNYSLTYKNTSDVPLKDVVIMASIKSDFLDWSTLKDDRKGSLGNDSITWTKEQIPALASLSPNEKGEINFSLKVRPYKDSDLGKSFAITSYAQFNFDNRQGSLADNKSNSIITRINSDLNLSEKVLYFDDNNRPVGSGPLPPKVNQKTSVRVYWQITNNLHELKDVSIITKLPEYVSFSNQANTSLGELTFDNETRLVTWKIAVLPVANYQAQAEFNISLTPTESQLNSLLVLLTGSEIKATDTDTSAIIIKNTNPKTSKLEDDGIASLNNSGLVE